MRKSVQRLDQGTRLREKSVRVADVVGRRIPGNGRLWEQPGPRGSSGLWGSPGGAVCLRLDL